MDTTVLSDSIAQSPVVVLVALSPVFCLQREIKISIKMSWNIVEEGRPLAYVSVGECRHCLSRS